MFGYIRADDFWHYSRDVQDLYEVSLRLMHEGVYPKLSYPLEWCTKQDVYDTYYTATDTELLNSVWVCEGLNEGSPCIDCSKCDERRSIKVHSPIHRDSPDGII